MNTPSDPFSLDDARRLEERYRQLGTRTPTCSKSDCGESNPFALTGRQPDIVCYEHLLEDQGRSRIESHHVTGRHNSDVVADIPGNDHRVLSEYQAAWPSATLRNPDASPLLAAAAAIRGWVDVLRIIIERSIAGIPEFLEWLHGELVDRFGADWWVKFGWNTAF